MAGTRHNRPPPVSKSDLGSKRTWTTWRRWVAEHCSREGLVRLATEPRHTATVGWLLLAVELVLNVAVVLRVPYTEIDWRAYMQECEGFLNGTLDYSQLRGDTGPLVYPAGFVYIYSGLYWVTSRGTNIRLAQWLFVALYLVQLHLTVRVYARTRRVPPYALVLATLTSYRVHSIYALRLFNDPVGVALAWAALDALLAGRWWAASTLYSLAVAVKMNILLYAPCLLAAYVACAGGWRAAARHVAWCAALQLLLAAPFLAANPRAYLEASFDVRRVFEHRWTVNWRFLERAAFESRYLHVGLLALHVALLLAFLPPAWRHLTSYAKLKQLEAQLAPQLDQPATATTRPPRRAAKARSKELSRDQQRFLDAYEAGLQQRAGYEAPEPARFTVDFSSSAQLLVLPWFVANLIGVACARSLHYQFYAWYFHSLLYLGWCTGLARPLVFLLLAVIECCWNCYPSTELSSAALHACHALLLAALYRAMTRAPPPPPPTTKQQQQQPQQHIKTA